MSDNIVKYNATQLIEQLSENGLIDNSSDLSHFIIYHKPEKELNIVSSILIGISTVITFTCLMALLSLLTNLSTEELIHSNIRNEISDSIGLAIILAIFSLIFIGISIGIKKAISTHDTFKNSFLISSSLALMFFGKYWFVTSISIVPGLYDLIKNWSYSLGGLIIILMTYQIYNVFLDRFLSTFSLFVSILRNIRIDHSMSNHAELMLNLFWLCQLIFVIVLLTNSKIKRDYLPLSYSLILSLFSVIIFFPDIMSRKITFFDGINLTTSIGLLIISGWILGDLSQLKSYKFILVAMGSILLGLIAAPGIAFAIIIISFGCIKHERMMVFIGVLFMLFFISLYYYQLEFTSSQKYFVLILNGIVLLAVRFYMQFKGDDKKLLPTL